MQIFEDAHWVLPWFLLLVGMVGVFRFVRGHLDKRPFTSVDRRYVMIFTGILDAQATVGVIVYLWKGFTGFGFPDYLFFHALTMLIAVLVPHFAIRREPGEANLHLHFFYALLASFLLMVVGVSFIPA